MICVARKDTSVNCFNKRMCRSDVADGAVVLLGCNRSEDIGLLDRGRPSAMTSITLPAKPSEKECFLFSVDPY